MTPGFVPRGSVPRLTEKPSLFSSAVSLTVPTVCVPLLLPAAMVIIRPLKAPRRSAGSAASAPVPAMTSGTTRSSLTGFAEVIVTVTTRPSTTVVGVTDMLTTGSSSLTVMVRTAAAFATSSRRDCGGFAAAEKLTVRSSSLTLLAMLLGIVKVSVLTAAPSFAAKFTDCDATAETPEGTVTVTVTGTVAPASRFAPRLTSAVTAPAASASESSVMTVAPRLSVSTATRLSRTVTVALAVLPLAVATRELELAMVTVKVSGSSLSVPTTSGIAIVAVRLPAGISKVVEDGRR